MKIEAERTPRGGVVLRPSGQLDADNAVALKERIRQAADQGALWVVVDLAPVEFIDSSGLSALVSGMKALRSRGGTLCLSGPRPQALTALRLTMLDRVFAIYTAVDEAIAQEPTQAP